MDLVISWYDVSGRPLPRGGGGLVAAFGRELCLPQASPFPSGNTKVRGNQRIACTHHHVDQGDAGFDCLLFLFCGGFRGLPLVSLPDIG